MVAQPMTVYGPEAAYAVEGKAPDLTRMSRTCGVGLQELEVEGQAGNLHRSPGDEERDESDVKKKDAKLELEKSINPGSWSRWPRV